MSCSSPFCERGSLIRLQHDPAPDRCAYFKSTWTKDSGILFARTGISGARKSAGQHVLKSSFPPGGGERRQVEKAPPRSPCTNTTSITGGADIVAAEVDVFPASSMDRFGATISIPVICDQTRASLQTAEHVLESRDTRWTVADSQEIKKTSSFYARSGLGLVEMSILRLWADSVPFTQQGSNIAPGNIAKTRVVGHLRDEPCAWTTTDWKRLIACQLCALCFVVVVQENLVYLIKHRSSSSAKSHIWHCRCCSIW